MKFEFTQEENMLREQVRGWPGKSSGPCPEAAGRGRVPGGLAPDHQGPGGPGAHRPVCGPKNTAGQGSSRGDLHRSEELTKVSPPVGPGLCGAGAGHLRITFEGNEEQKKRYLPGCQGEFLGSFSLTEQTQGRTWPPSRPGPGGRRILTSSAGKRLRLRAASRTSISSSPDLPGKRRKGISAFLVEAGRRHRRSGPWR